MTETDIYARPWPPIDNMSKRPTPFNPYPTAKLLRKRGKRVEFDGEWYHFKSHYQLRRFRLNATTQFEVDMYWRPQICAPKYYTSTTIDLPSKPPHSVRFPHSLDWLQKVAPRCNKYCIGLCIGVRFRNFDFRIPQIEIFRDRHGQGVPAQLFRSVAHLIRTDPRLVPPGALPDRSVTPQITVYASAKEIVLKGNLVVAHIKAIDDDGDATKILHYEKHAFQELISGESRYG